MCAAWEAVGASSSSEPVQERFLQELASHLASLEASSREERSDEECQEEPNREEPAQAAPADQGSFAPGGSRAVSSALIGRRATHVRFWDDGPRAFNSSIDLRSG